MIELNPDVLAKLRKRLVRPEMMASPTRVAIALRDLGLPSVDEVVVAYYDALRAEPTGPVEVMVATNTLHDIEKVLKALNAGRITAQRPPNGGCGYTIITITKD